MANYYCTSRTNYFHVKDENKFMKIINEAFCCEGDIYLWSDKKDKDGKQLYGFGAYDAMGYPDYSEDSDYPFCDSELLYKKLQEVVAEDDAIIVMESGAEKLRYVIGYCAIITSKEIRYVDMVSQAKCVAKEMLQNSAFVTEVEY